MSVQVYGCNHVAIEVDDIKKAVAFYKDVFNLEKLNGGEGDAFFKLGEHQFLAIFEVEKLHPRNASFWDHGARRSANRRGAQEGRRQV